MSAHRPRGAADITRQALSGPASHPWIDPEMETWELDAICSQTDPEIFFPEKGGSTREAKHICSRCPVRAECLEYALLHQERFGIWGGLSERERRSIIRGRRGTPHRKGRGWAYDDDTEEAV
jgi:hypothetical protein